MDDGHYPYIFLKVFDKDAVSGDDPMGQAVINLGEIEEGPEMKDMWLSVAPCVGCVEARGRIKVGIQFSRAPTPRFDGFFGGMLLIKIIEGKDLLAVDKGGGLFGGGSSEAGSSDPYVKLEGYKKSKGWAVLSKGKNKIKLETFDKTKPVKKVSP